MRLHSDQSTNIATLGSPDGGPVTRSLSGQLTALFATVLEGYDRQDLMVQMTIEYQYAIAADRNSVRIPVLVLPPTSVGAGMVAADGVSPDVERLVGDLARTTEQWFDTTRPSPTGGLLALTLIITSALTADPAPIVSLDNLQLPIQYVSPPLATG